MPTSFRESVSLIEARTLAYKAGRRSGRPSTTLNTCFHHPETTTASATYPSASLNAMSTGVSMPHPKLGGHFSVSYQDCSQVIPVTDVI